MIVSIDIGTTAAKTCVVGRQGQVLSASDSSYPLTGGKDRSEQNPRDWWEAVQAGCRAVLAGLDPAAVEAVILSGQMQDLIPLSGGEASGPAILYNDLRAKEEFQALASAVGPDYLKDCTANRQDASSLAAKILWLRRHAPDRAEGADCFLLGAHDYICWKMTNRLVTDYTNASTTGLFNFHKSTWDEKLLGEIGLDASKLPSLAAADSIAGTLTSSAARSLGLPPGIPVLHGAGDAGANTIGSGAGVPGVYSCYIGTSGWIATTLEEGIGDPDKGIFNLKHPDPGKTIGIGPMMLAGGNIDWAIGALFHEEGDAGSEVTGEDYRRFDASAALSAPGAEGLFYLPYLMGERSPVNDPYAKGAFIGLSRFSTKRHMARAVLEGIGYSFRLIMDQFRPSGEGGGCVYLSGGGAKSAVLGAILASMLNTRILVPENARETGILGNYIIAGKALGWFGGFALPDHCLRIAAEYRPDAALVKSYAQGLRIFEKLYPRLKDSFKELSDGIGS